MFPTTFNSSVGADVPIPILSEGLAKKTFPLVLFHDVEFNEPSAVAGVCVKSEIWDSVIVTFVQSSEKIFVKFNPK